MKKNLEIARDLAIHITNPEKISIVIDLIKMVDFKDDFFVNEKKIYTELAYLKYSLSIICVNVMAEKKDIEPILNETHREIFNLLNKAINIDISDFNRNCAERFNVYREINLKTINQPSNEFITVDCGNEISIIFLGMTNPFLSVAFIKFFMKEVESMKCFITLLKGQSMEDYCKKLCKDIKLYYLEGFDACRKENGSWFILSNKSMKNYVLSRQGWAKSDKSDDSFLFMTKYPLTVNIIYSGSPGALMMDTAIGIAKAELLDNLHESENEDDYIISIVECMKRQNWVIPFMRK